MTDFLARIADKARIVLFVPSEKLSYFEERFGSERILVRGINAKLSARDLFLRKVALMFSGTHGLFIKRRAQLYADNRVLTYVANSTASFLVGNSRVGPWIAQTCNRIFLRSSLFRSSFEEFSPDAVFATDVQNEFDVRMLSEAKALHLPTIGMVRSWDNLSSKGLLRILPDRFVVHNEIIKRELIELNYAPTEAISVIGIPHYDRYSKPDVTERELFLQSFGFDPERKTILYAPIGDRYISDNGLDSLVIETLMKLEVNVLVRLPPTDHVSYKDAYQGPALLAIYGTGSRPWRPGKRGEGVKESEIDSEDEQRLVDSLAHADVVVTGHSTIVIDAAAFDRPIVVIAFDEKERSYWDSVKRYYDYEYYAPIRESGGIRFAESEADLLVQVGEYLKNAERDREGRERLVREQCGALDGRSAERLANEIVNVLATKVAP